MNRCIEVVPRFLLVVALSSTLSASIWASAQAIDVSEPRAPKTALELRSPARMTPEDTQVVVSRAPDIDRAAELYGYTLDRSWTYEQTLCPAAPNHILLNYSRTEPNGAVSSFGAVIPRAGLVVEIFPILRSGISPYVQPWGEHSYVVFNSLVARERKASKKLDVNSAFAVPWKTWALCYVALVTTPAKMAQEPFQLTSTITVSMRDRGLIEVGFTSSDGEQDYSDWNLKFSPHGELTKVARSQHPVTFIPADNDPALSHGRPVPRSTEPVTKPEIR